MGYGRKDPQTIRIEATTDAGLKQKVDGLESQLAQTATVKMYGAKGDGVTDDTSSFVAAIASENRILIPPGVYRITRSIAVKSNLTLLGAGNDTVLLFDFPGEADPSGFPIDMFAPPTGSPELRNIEMGCFSVKHSETTQKKGQLIIGYKWHNVYLHDIKASIFRIGKFSHSSNLNFSNLYRDEVEARFDDNSENGGSVLSFAACQYVQISKCKGFGLAEGCDFGASDYITISDVMFVGRATTTTQDALDLGAVTHLKINNFYFENFGYGIHLKEEVGYTNSNCFEVEISNGEIRNFHITGLRLFSRAQNPVPSEAVIRNVTVSNVRIKSDITTSIGVAITNNGNTSGCKNVELNSLDIYVPVTALSVRAADDIRVIGGRYESIDNNVIDIKETSSGTASVSNVSIANAKIKGTLTNSSAKCVSAVGVKHITIHNCEIIAVVSKIAMDITNCLHPTITNNRFKDCNRGVNIGWTLESYLVETGERLAKIQIDGNQIYNWGGDYAILFSCSLGDTVNPYLGLSIQNNILLHTDVAASKFGVYFSHVDQTFGLARVAGNVIRCKYPTYNHSRLVSANSLISNTTN